MWRPAPHSDRTEATQPKGALVRYKIFSERTGLKVSELALGTGMFGQAWGYGATPEEVRRIIAGFADAGGNFIDTADNYQHGVSETLVGEAIAANRDDFIIATEFTRMKRFWPWPALSSAGTL